MTITVTIMRWLAVQSVEKSEPSMKLLERRMRHVAGSKAYTSGPIAESDERETAHLLTSEAQGLDSWMLFAE